MPPGKPDQDKPADLGATLPGAGGKPDPIPASLSLSADPKAPIADDPGALGAPDAPPLTLPPELAAALTGKQRRLAFRLFAGDSWQAALDATGTPKRAKLRDQAPPRVVVQAAQWLIRAEAQRCGVSRSWLILQAVSLYRRSVQAEPVLDRKGEPTGEYRMDGATAARCLEMLGKEAGGVFGAKGGAPMGVDQVAALLVAVAQRGRPELVIRPAIEHAQPADRGAAQTAEKPAESRPAFAPLLRNA